MAMLARGLWLALWFGLAGCSSPPGGEGADLGGADLAAADLGGADLGGPDLLVPVERATVLSINLHCLRTDGTRFTDNVARFARVAAVAAERGADVVLAQEVCERPGESAQALLGAALGQASGTPWSSTAAFAHRAWTGTSDEADEHVAVFCRGALSRPAQHTYLAQGALQRVTVGATCQGLRVYSLHLDHAVAAARTEQARESAGLALFDTDPDFAALLGGDLNTRVGTPPHQALLDAGFLDASAALPQTRIDHVLLHRAAPFRAIESALLFVGEDAVSDHPGVLVRLVREPKAAVTPTRIHVRGVDPAVRLFVRGDRAPLDWLAGWPAFATPSGEHRMVATELPAGPFQYKLLRADRDWQLGDNQTGTGQTDNTTMPTF